MATFARILAFVGALAAWSGLAVQLLILVKMDLGVLGGLWRYFAFFTIAMNLLAATQLTWALLRPQLSPLRVQLMSAATCYMTAGCIVYALVLADLWDPDGLQLFADIALHYAAPILILLFWLIDVPKATLRWGDAIKWVAGPFVYFIYALARAQFDGFYPYPFIDVSELGWAQVGLNAVGVLLIFLVIGLVLVAIARFSAKRAAPARA